MLFDLHSTADSSNIYLRASHSWWSCHNDQNILKKINSLLKGRGYNLRWNSEKKLGLCIQGGRKKSKNVLGVQSSVPESGIHIVEWKFLCQDNTTLLYNEG